MWKPDLVIFEDIQLQVFDGGEQVITFKKLAHLQGVLKNYCYENEITFNTDVDGWILDSHECPRHGTDNRAHPRRDLRCPELAQ